MSVDPIITGNDTTFAPTSRADCAGVADLTTAVRAAATAANPRYHTVMTGAPAACGMNSS
jgi:hypothetical protein